jgi:hypothetical protein
MCVLPASHLKVHDKVEQGLAGERSVYADFICSRRHTFSPVAWAFRRALYGLPGSVAKGQKPKKNIKRAKHILRGWENLGPNF